MSAIFKLSFSDDWARCSFSVAGIDNISASGLRISFENSTLNVSVPIVESNIDHDGQFIYLPSEQTVINGFLNLSHPSIQRYTTLSIYVSVEIKDKDAYKLIQIVPFYLSVPKTLPSNKNMQIDVRPSFVEYGDDFTVAIKGQPNVKTWVGIGGKEFVIRTDELGNGSVRLLSSNIVTPSDGTQHLRLTVSDDSLTYYDCDLSVAILPRSTLKVATAASTLINSTVDIINPFDVTRQSLPVAGTPELQGCGLQTEATITTIDKFGSSTSTSTYRLPRINGFSVAKTLGDAALVAISSQSPFDPTATTITDPVELSRVQASRVHILYTSSSVGYAAPVRRARIIDASPDYHDCPSGFTVEVDADLAADPKLTRLWAIDGNLHFSGLPLSSEYANKTVGVLFRIVKKADFNRWVIQPDDANVDLIANIGDCFSFIAYGGLACSHTYPLHLNPMQPLPYISVNGLAVSAANPQIASNWQDAPNAPLVGYVIAEAPVGGAAQLFLFSFNASDGSTFGWQQLTFNGENKNAKIAMDKIGNLHIVWESNRCQPGQIYYSMLGPSSRSTLNETFASIVDKNAYLNYLVSKANADDNDKSTLASELTNLVTVSGPIATDTRNLDSFGVRQGNMWTSYFATSGTATIVNNSTLSASGNPAKDKFANFASLTHDEFEVALNNSFQQFSFQVSFDLNVSSLITTKSFDDLLDLYISWKGGFTPIVDSGTSDINVYGDNHNNRYSIEEMRLLYDQIIPIVGSYEAPLLTNHPNSGATSPLVQLKLRHYMVALVPEKARFLASNIETAGQFINRTGSNANYTQFQQVEYYTGKCRLALITETSANLADPRLAAQRYHVVKHIGTPFDITVSHNYKLAVYYAKLREEDVVARLSTDTVTAAEQDVRFTGDIIIAVDNVPVGAANFIPDFSDSYQQFDIGLGCPIVSEYNPSNLNPYDGTVNADLSVTLAYANVAIGPHTIVPTPTLASFWASDRDTSKMYIASNADAFTSKAAWEDTATTALLPTDYPNAPLPISMGATDGGYNNGASIKASWTPVGVPDISGYYIYRANLVNGVETAHGKIATILTPNTSWIDTTVSLGNLYVYYISVFDRFGNESVTTRVLGALRSPSTNILPPSNIKAVVNAQLHSVIEWDMPLVIGGVVCNWEIDWDTVGKSAQLLHTLESTWDETNYTDTTNTLSSNTIIYYAIAARCNLYISSFSYVTVRYPQNIIVDMRQNMYKLAFGLNCGGRLTQLPITLEGRNLVPAIAVDNCGHAHVAFQSNRNNKWDIYYATSKDAASPFRFDTRITNSSGNSLMPSIGVDTNGRRLIAWQDNRDGVYQIYMARSNVVFDCDRNLCLRQEILSTDYPTIPHFEYEGPYVLGEYEYEYGLARPYGEICKMAFSFQNQSATSKKYHFIANFYSDPGLSTLYKTIDSRLNIAGWFTVDGMLPYTGIIVPAGGVANVWYEPSAEDNLSGKVYYVQVQLDSGTNISSYSETITFYCPINQLARCGAPCVYTNMGIATQNVHFRISFYTDSTRNSLVMSSSSILDQKHWVASGQLFPPTGVAVNSLETINVIYKPDFLPEDQSFLQNATTISSLLCNTSYFVVIESNVNGVFAEIENYALSCDCSNFNTPAWSKDNLSKEWLCSGQGSMDLRITQTTSNSLFPSVSGSDDGIIYIGWEDHRTSTIDRIAPSPYYAVWDAREDVLYSSAQNYSDGLLSDSDSMYKPLMLANNMQHLSAFFTDGTSVFSKVCSLYRDIVTDPTIIDTTEANLVKYVFPDNALSFSGNSATQCFSVNVFAADVANTYHLNSDTPVAMVEKCRVQLEIISPANAFAVRFRNDGQSTFSEWISIRPQYTQLASSSSSGPVRISDYLQAYYIADNRFVAQWILSPDSGNKTVDCEIMTQFGLSPIISVNIIARYKELKYSVYFYHDAQKTILASQYNGYPVISTNALYLTKDAVNTLSTQVDPTVVNNNTIYVDIVFEDPAYLNELLSISQLDAFSGGSLTFDVILPGITLFDNTLILVPETPVTFDFNNPSSSVQTVKPGTYTGSFQLKRSDGFDYQDGLATVVVNVPSSCFSENADAPCNKLRATVKDVKNTQAAIISANVVTAEKFRYNYNPQLSCTFTSCVQNTETINNCNATGVVRCDLLDWHPASLGEPCFFVRTSQNYPTWVQYSPEFELDFSDSRIDYLTFGSTSAFEGVLILLKANDSITVTTAETTCPSDASSPCLGSTFATMTRAVNFDIPVGSVVVYHNYILNKAYYAHAASSCNYPSASKIFKANNVLLNTIPQGSGATDGMDSTTGAANWNITAAQGKKYAVTLTLPTPGADGCLLTNLTSGISKAELQMLGFIAPNGQLRFRLGLIRSGIGYANIEDMSCATFCDEYQ
jgi:hypothetical protein